MMGEDEAAMMEEEAQMEEAREMQMMEEAPEMQMMEDEADEAEEMSEERDGGHDDDDAMVSLLAAYGVYEPSQEQIDKYADTTPNAVRNNGPFFEQFIEPTGEDDGSLFGV